MRDHTTTASSASRTQTQTQAEPSVSLPTSGTLRLRAASISPSEERHIQWAEDVIDNEGMGKKSSKVCCIYHKPHAVGESSDEGSSDESSSSDESDSGADDGAARPVRRSRARRKPRHHGHEGDGDGKGDAGKRKASPNAYEKMPKYDKGKAKTEV
jgi:protein phosphatase 1 regulatory subunit 11